ncbi:MULTISPECIES: riboflavin synthase [Clostridium]|uniref:Riboflavin synthase n=1 Tax=Clostridium cadaveris TaxID=1529 RepID=A0A1I2LNS7_9CLOT|nr:riboflavin synthase [Clostridium cadaveris]MDU4952054.1 riboflavin synthase [Clostridium sp.]MDM8310949.1 riboflavin synthase [Clostridium cadaveris]MDY4948935.1 riboflavin synthase [Clostridium cadaveris]NME63023.1 riboflavin synthase [Clostridium cadaveris]NWK10006.1 riboflavin synthase [Clostridium cadaveris]
MFTGIIEEIGTVKSVVKSLHSSILTIEGKIIFNDLHIGDSVSVNGVCLTVTGFSSNTFTADVMNETLFRSSLGNLKSGSCVNLERALKVNSRLGGHIVSGHIDGTGVISRIQKDDNSTLYTIKTSPKLMNYIIEKGSIAIDGISLTVSKLSLNDFTVGVIPHTSKETILSQKSVGDTVNLENDIIGKYIEKLITIDKSNITKDFLIKFGY